MQKETYCSLSVLCQDYFTVATCLLHLRPVSVHFVMSIEPLIIPWTCEGYWNLNYHDVNMFTIVKSYTKYCWSFSWNTMYFWCLLQLFCGLPNNSNMLLKYVRINCQMSDHSFYVMAFVLHSYWFMFSAVAIRQSSARPPFADDSDTTMEL